MLCYPILIPTKIKFAPIFKNNSLSDKQAIEDGGAETKEKRKQVLVEVTQQVEEIESCIECTAFYALVPWLLTLFFMACTPHCQTTPNFDVH
ncbi:hypothetical protein FRX31_006282 [Thalictrum thalictroides]|uniref:Uncharacterized protein n=1 Tax=Thalictrum thalictroides TaxID=46969 RepID=A0A7J6X340_THATH|nr:hypothetical protein FRX31_006282 [Thalictrum thalictroides]